MISQWISYSRIAYFQTNPNGIEAAKDWIQPAEEQQQQQQHHHHHHQQQQQQQQQHDAQKANGFKKHKLGLAPKHSRRLALGLLGLFEITLYYR